MRLVCSPFARSLTTTTTTSHTHTAAPEMTIGASTRVGCGAHYPAAWRSHGPRTQSMADPQRRHPYSPPISPPHPTPLRTPEGRITLPHPRPPCGPRPFSRLRPFRGTPAAHFYTLLRPPALSPPCCTQRQWCARDIIIIIITPRLVAFCFRVLPFAEHPHATRRCASLERCRTHGHHEKPPPPHGLTRRPPLMTKLNSNIRTAVTHE